MVMVQRLTIIVVITASVWGAVARAEPVPDSSIRVRVEAGIREQRVLPKASRYYYVGGFQPNYLEVQQGQQVTIELVATKGTHSLAIPALGVKSNEVADGQSTEMIFSADQSGEFEITCDTVCGKFHRRMVGILVVSPSESR